MDTMPYDVKSLLISFLNTERQIAKLPSVDERNQMFNVSTNSYVERIIDCIKSYTPDNLSDE